MTLSIPEIKDLDRPHEVFNDTDTLLEHQEVLDSLSPEEKLDVASKMVLHCPELELRTLNYSVRALRNHVDSEETFHAVISGLLEIRQRIIGLNDERNPQAHNQLLAPELNLDLFTAYNDFSLSLLNNYDSTALAEKLALSTPIDKCSELAKNAHLAFLGSTFATEVGAAFTLVREIRSTLLSDTPDQFFTSPEFNAELCKKYYRLFNIIEDKAEQISEKLDPLSPDLKATVLANLQSLFSEQGTVSVKEASANPFGLFSSSPKADPQQKKQGPVSSMSL
jgi:hypothetical protein